MDDINQIVKEIEEFCGFELEHLPHSVVYLNCGHEYRMPNIWEKKDDALRVLVDIKYNDYTLIPF